MSIERNPESAESYSAKYQTKLAVHERDQYTCVNCRKSFEEPSEFDVDHDVARGKGGSNAIRNKNTKCRRCHEAKHDERDHAPTIRFISTGDMIQEDFIWYRHFWREIFPAMSEQVLNYRIEPVLDLADETEYRALHIPLGDVRRADEVLSDLDGADYAPMGLHHYMG